MKGKVSLVLISALLAFGSSFSAMANGPLVLTPISEGSPVHVDQYGNTWFCETSASVCVPLTTSAPPIED